MDFRGTHVLILDGYARQCLPFLRAFKEFGCEVTLLCDSKIDCGYWSRLPDHKIIGDCNLYEYEKSEETIAKLIKTGMYDIVLPLVDTSARVLANNKKEFSKYAYIVVSDKENFEKAQDKLEVMKVCMKNGISCPYTLFNVNSIDDVLNSELKFPIVIKPRCGSGARGFYKIKAAKDFEQIVKTEGINLKDYVVQECLPIDSLLISDNIFIDDNGEVKSSFIYASYRYFPLNGGTGTFNISINREDVHKECAKLVKIMGLTGCVGVDLMIDPRDDHAKVIEINPRPLACAKMGFVTGINQAQQILEASKGLEVTSFQQYKCGMALRMTQTDILWFIKSPNRFTIKPSFFKIKNTKDQMFSWDDPLPWFAFLIRGIRNYKSEMKRRQV